MKKYLLFVYAFNALLLATSPSFAANPFGPAAPAPASINIYDWYNLGEMTGAASQAIFNYNIYEQMDDTYKQIYDLMVKTQVGDTTINAFKQWYPVLKRFLGTRITKPGLRSSKLRGRSHHCKLPGLKGCTTMQASRLRLSFFIGLVTTLLS